MNQDQGKYGQTIIDSGNSHDQGRYGDNFSQENQSGNSQNKPTGDAWICPSCETVNYGATCEVCGFSKPSEDENSHVQQNKKTRASRSLIAAAVVAALLVVGFFTVHFWTEGTCTEDSVCKLCGKIRVSAPGHQWKNATCTSAKLCSVCGETQGQALGHNWEAASCTVPQTCLLCGITNGNALPHNAVPTEKLYVGECSTCGNIVNMQRSSAICTTDDVGAVIDSSGQLWVWTEDDKIAFQTEIKDVVSLASDWYGACHNIVFLKKDGTLGYIYYNEIDETFSDEIVLQTPAVMTHVVIDRNQLFALDQNGYVYKYVLDFWMHSSPFKLESFPSFADFQIHDGGDGTTYFARSIDGDFYGWGVNKFGDFSPSTEAYLALPSKLLIESNLKDARIFGMTYDESLLNFFFLNSTGGVQIFYSDGSMEAFGNCTSAYCGANALYMITSSGDLLARGSHLSGADLSDGTNIFYKTDHRAYRAYQMGSQIEYISIEGWSSIALLKDGRVRIWGQSDDGLPNDHMLKNADGTEFNIN